MPSTTIESISLLLPARFQRFNQYYAQDDVRMKFETGLHKLAAKLVKYSHVSFRSTIPL